MKRVLSLILALTLVFALAVPVLAAEITDTDGTASGNAVVSYEVSSGYTVNIPTTGVTITGAGATATATATVGVIAGALIDANKHLEFSISAATNYDDTVGFRLKNGSRDTVFLHYAISCEDAEDIVKNTVFLSATAAEANAGKSVILTFTPDTATQAGAYTDTITFNIATVNNDTP